MRWALFVIFWIPLPALSLAQAPDVPPIRTSEFARPPLCTVAIGFVSRFQTMFSRNRTFFA
jgi:hypothetical protein